MSLVGGCCGTTPRTHPRNEGQAEDEACPRAHRGSQAAADWRVPWIRRPWRNARNLAARSPTANLSSWSRSFRPKGTDGTKEIEGSRYLKSVGVDAVNIPDSPRASARMSNQALCLMVAQQVGIEPMLHYTCRDRNVLGIQSDLLGASALGIRNLICITGDPPKMGDYPDATAVFDVDAIGLVNIVHNLNHGLDIGSNPIGNGTKFVIGVGANPGVPNIDEEIRRFEYKVQAGAEYAVTQPVFDLRLLEDFLRRIEHCRIPVDRRHLAAGQRPQRRVHEERAARLRARRDHRAYVSRRHRRGCARGRRRHRARHALCRARHGAGRADQRSPGTLLVRHGCAGSAGQFQSASV